MRNNPTEYEIGYINGFYSALSATAFLTTLEGSTVADIQNGIQEALQDMKNDGDLEYIKSGIDDFIAAAEAAEAAGLRDEFLDFLDTLDANKENK